ncbi:MAG: glycosyltransferase family 4 protein [Candidatus Eisenbacteria bacterium]
MRIAFFTRCLPAHGLGGMEIHAEQVARGLAARGHEVVVYTTRLDDGPRVVADASGDNPKIHFLAGTRPRSYIGGYWAVSRAAFLRDHAARAFDVAFSESSGANGLLRDASPIVPVTVFLVGTAGAELVSKIRKKAFRPRTILGIGWNLISHLQSRRYLPRAARILCESEGLRTWAMREMPFEASRVSVAWLGVDTSRFTPEGPVLPEIRDRAGARTCIIFGGRFEKEKGFDVAIRAVAPILTRYSDVCAFLVGAGREKTSLTALARPLTATGRFHILTPIPHERLAEMYRGAAVYLMPTIRKEGSALSLVEAMACGCAVVASRVGGLPSLLRDEVDAILVPPGDVEALSRAIARLLDDPDLRVRLAVEAAATARARFSLDSMIDQIEETLHVAAREH